MGGAVAIRTAGAADFGSINGTVRRGSRRPGFRGMGCEVLELLFAAVDWSARSPGGHHHDLCARKNWRTGGVFPLEIVEP